MLNADEKNLDDIKKILIEYKNNNKKIKKIKINRKNFNNTHIENLNYIISECSNIQILLEFNDCKFDNISLKIKNINKIEFYNCNGDLSIVGEKEYPALINGLYFNHNNFNNITINDSQITDIRISKNSFGKYTINNNIIKELHIEEDSKGFILKDIYFIPIALLLPFVFCNMSVWFPILSDFSIATFILLLTVHLVIILTLSDIAIKLKIKSTDFIKNKTHIIIRNLIFIAPLIICVSFFVSNYFNVNNHLRHSEFLIFGEDKDMLRYPVLAEFLIFLIWGTKKEFDSFYADLKLISLENNKINKFIYVSQEVKFYTYILSEAITNKVQINSSNIISSELINLEGYDNKEKIFFLLEKQFFFFDKFSCFEELEESSDKNNFEFILNNKNKLLKIIRDKTNMNSIYYQFASIYFMCLSIVYLLLIRIKNITISLSIFLIIGLSIFAHENMTITDTTTQVYIKLNNFKHEESEKFENIKGEKNTKIDIPNFYPEYSPLEYTLGKLFPFAEKEQNVLFRPNNSVTIFYNALYKILGVIHAAAFLFIITNRFLKIKKE